MAWRSRATLRPSSVARSRASSLFNAGLSTLASTCPAVTGAPATTLKVTVPMAEENRVGLFATTTRPSAATSRTKVPRVTVAMRTRARGTTTLEFIQDLTTNPKTTTSAATPHPSITMIRRRRRVPLSGSTITSCADVSRTLASAWKSMDRPMPPRRFHRDQQPIDHLQIVLQQPAGLLFQRQQGGQVVVACLTVGTLCRVVVVLGIEEVEHAACA